MGQLVQRIESLRDLQRTCCARKGKSWSGRPVNCASYRKFHETLDSIDSKAKSSNFDGISAAEHLERLRILERETGIEPATNGLGSRYSTIELLPLCNRLYPQYRCSSDPGLSRRCSAISSCEISPRYFPSCHENIFSSECAAIGPFPGFPQIKGYHRATNAGRWSRAATFF
jgi:hypothetical protein